MRPRFEHLRKLLFDRTNYGVAAPGLFTGFELKLLAAITVLAATLIWALVQNQLHEGIFGVALVAGLAVYLSYVKYYRTYKPAMDRWALRELASPQHPRKEFKVAGRDILISPDEVALIAQQHGVDIVCHISPDNAAVEIYELKRSYQQRIQTNQLKTAWQFPPKHG